MVHGPNDRPEGNEPDPLPASLDAIASEVSAIRQRSQFGGNSPVTLGEARRLLASTDALLARVRDRSLLAASMPPRPPTLRARFGALLIAPVRRIVFWLAHQVQEFEVAAAASLAGQAELLKGAANAIEGIESFLKNVEARLDHHDRLLSRILELEARLADLSATQASTQSQINVLRLGLASLRDSLQEASASTPKREA
jgi:hypothetical protein